MGFLFKGFIEMEKEKRRKNRLYISRDDEYIFGAEARFIYLTSRNHSGFLLK